MQKKTITLGHRERGTTAQVWQGGSGPAILLVHGAWAGARAHWSPIWEKLAEDHTVIAPELPDFFPGSGERKHTYADYADWLDEVLRTLDCGPAVVVGNSLGACLAWYLAVRHPGSCSALALVDGGPPPPLSPWMRWLMVRTPFGRVARSQLRQKVFGPEALAHGFAHPDQAPEALRTSLQSPDFDLVDHLMKVYLRSGVPSKQPAQPSMVIWGAQDRLPRCTPTEGRKVHELLPRSTFAVIDDAGHLPQVEQPQRFLETLGPLLQR